MKTPAELMEMVREYGDARSDAERYYGNLGLQAEIDSNRLETEIRAALTASMVWQGMDSAPKDGTRVILSWGWKSMVGYYLDNTATASPWAGWKPPSMEPWPQGQPNAWMPLPPPPAEGSPA